MASKLCLTWDEGQLLIGNKSSISKQQRNVTSEVGNDHLRKKKKIDISEYVFMFYSNFVFLVLKCFILKS